MKKNTFKKLMSAIVSVAMLCSMMIIPANAIVPGESAINSSVTTLAQYDCATKTTQYITVSNSDNVYSGTTTYDFLSDEELSRCSQNPDVEMRGIIGEDNRFPGVPTGVFSSAVLIIVRVDTNNDYLADTFCAGTGFLVSENVVVSAMHCLYPNMEDLTNYPVIANIVSAQVYYNVSVSAESQNLLGALTGKEYAHITSVTYDPRYLTTFDAGNYVPEYDWCVIELDEAVEAEYLECDNISQIYANTEIATFGYPRGANDNMWFVLYYTGGLTTSFDGKILEHNADVTEGQSGSPVLMSIGDNSAIGFAIITYGEGYTGTDAGSTNYARVITPEVYNAIIRTMISS